MTSRMNDNLMKALFFAVIMVVLLFQSVFTNAQTYKGFIANFGAATYDVNTDIDALKGRQLIQVGGRIGFLYGTEPIRTTLVAGYYSSTGSTPGTIDRYALAANANFYPLSWVTKHPSRLRPYLTMGVSLNNFRVHGYFINREPGVTNYSQAEAPYLGSWRQVNGIIGGGLEFSLLEEYDFVHIFSDFTLGKDLSHRPSGNTFAGTALKDQVQVNVGITFGLHR